jgi:hypothetical protein
MGMADKFPESLPAFQQLFPDDLACARYLEAIRWRDGFACPRCGVTAEPFRFANRPQVLRCRGCKRDTALTAGTVMESTHTPLSTWFGAAFLISSLPPGMSAMQLQRQLGLTRYETAFQILHKLRSGMARTSGRIGLRTHVEVDETWVGGETRGKGQGVHDQACVVGGVEVKPRLTKPEREDAKCAHTHSRQYTGQLRLAVVPDRTAKTLCGFVETQIDPATEMVVTDAWQGYAPLAEMGYQHLAVAERGDPGMTANYPAIIHLVFSNLKAWINDTHHGVSADYLQAYLNEFAFRFNRRFYPFNAFRSLLGLATKAEAPTYAELYDGE